MSGSDPSAGSADYWDARHRSVDESAMSWFQERPETSLRLIARVADGSASVVDVGGGASRLVDALLERGHRDITVVDISQQALHASRDRVGEAPVTWIESDVRDWQPARTFDVWHDRAAYHFLVDADDQHRYWELVRESVPHGGHVVIATFAEDGPATCSGLPVQRYGAEALASVMGEGFAVLASEREEHRTPSGVTQPFAWLLAQRT
jgi:SAM-dependent methyltransferase